MLKVQILEILLLPTSIQAQLAPQLVPQLDSGVELCNTKYRQDQLHTSCSNNEYPWNGIQSFAQCTTITSDGYGQTIMLTTGVPLTNTGVPNDQTLYATPDYSLPPTASVYGEGETTPLGIVTTNITAPTATHSVPVTQTSSTSPRITTTLLPTPLATSLISTTPDSSTLPSTTTLIAAADSLSVGAKPYALGIMIAVGLLV
jgi:hypothetical protein